MFTNSFLLKKDVITKCAQLAQFDEELYKVKFVNKVLEHYSYLVCFAVRDVMFMPQI